MIYGGESVRQKMKETAILSGSVARTFWLHTLIHTPYAPASCVRTDASSLAHYRLAKLARKAGAEAKGVHHRDALGLDRPGEYPAAQVSLRVSARSYIRNATIAPGGASKDGSGCCQSLVDGGWQVAARHADFLASGLAAELGRIRARKWYN